MQKKIIIFLRLIFILLSPYKTLYSVQVNNAAAYSVLVQPDGNIVSSGYLIDSNNVIQIATARYESNGVLDSFFGPDGDGVSTAIIGKRAQATSSVLQQDGKIVVSGFVIDNDGITKQTISRYAIDGTLDSSFGDAGIVIEQVGDGGQLNAVKIQADGKIIACGYAVTNGQLNTLVMRYNSDGSIDSGFGDNGIVITHLGYHTGADALDIQADSKILVAGFSVINSIRQVCLIRYNDDGSVDQTYGNNGSVVTPIGSSSEVFGLKVDQNSFGIICGVSDNSLLLARYDNSGNLDNSFGDNGIVLQTLGKNSVAKELVIQTDGNIVIAGSVNGLFLVARYNTVGLLDTNFGTNGIVKTVITANDNAQSVALQSDGKIIVAGYTTNNFALIRYLSNGIVDTSWGIAGLVTIPGGIINIAATIFDNKSVGIDGGTFPSGSWVTRDLTTLLTPTSNISLNFNQIRLEIGSYDFVIFAPAYKVGSHKIRLQNVTNNTTVMYGNSSYSDTTSGAQTTAILAANVTVNSPTIFEVQHQCTVSRADDGFGVAGGIGDEETYTVVRINQKIYAK